MTRTSSFFELAKLATGLSEKELDQLKRPDYVSIAQYVHEMSTRPAAFFLDQHQEASHDEPVHLLLPLDAAGRSLTELSLEMPALRATKVMKKTHHQQRACRVHHRALHRFDDPRSRRPDGARLDATAGAHRRFFKSTGGLLSQRDIEVILDVVPLIYSVNEAEILDWDAGKALRRYDIAITRLGVKQE